MSLKHAQTPCDSAQLSTRYLSETRAQPFLTADEELELARAVRHQQSVRAAHLLAASNARFVAKIAAQYKGYGLPALDLVQEGNTGLLLAVQKFDPERGNRFATYAVWWIRAAIHAYVIRNWSLVKLGTTEAQRKLFFRVRSERAQLEAENFGRHVSTKQLANRLSVSEAEVESVEMRLRQREVSYDVVTECSLDENLGTSDAARIPADKRLEFEEHRAILRHALSQLRLHCTLLERCILDRRMMTDEPATLQTIGTQFALSRERVRQVEAALLMRLRTLFARQARKGVRSHIVK